MQQIALTNVPSQTLTVILVGQNCQIRVSQRGDDIYLDLYSNGAAIVLTRMCRNKIRLLLNMQYLGFVGDFVMVDTQGDTQPHYSGLGDRYQLLYLEASELT